MISSGDDGGATTTTAERTGKSSAAFIESSSQQLDELIHESNWDAAYEVFVHHPEYAKLPFEQGGTRTSSKLHYLCSVGSCPVALIELVAGLHPFAIVFPDFRYGDTPLHVVCRNSQTTSEKLQVLLNVLSHALMSSRASEAAAPQKSAKERHGDVLRQVRRGKQDGDSKTSSSSEEGASPQPPRTSSPLLIQNVFGGTALHSAANHNALIQVLQLLVDFEPQLVQVTTRDGTHAVSALYLAYIQTIPGYMAIANLLNEGGAPAMISGHLERFWNKAVYLASRSFCLSGACPEQVLVHNADTDASSRYVLHGLLQCSVELNLYKAALILTKKDDDDDDGGSSSTTPIMTPDAHGNLPLHRLVQNRPYRLKEREAMEATIAVAPQAAAILNNRGESPLSIAILNKIPWHAGVDLLAAKNDQAVCQRYRRLLPFQLAAAYGGKVGVETTFQLLRTRPDLLAW